MKAKKFKEFITEGTWYLSEDEKLYDKFIEEITKLEEKYYKIIGDDEIYNNLDEVITRTIELKNLMIEKKLQKVTNKYNL